MPAPPELVIFDCDGVLVDSERIAIRVDAVVLDRLGWSLSETEIIERFVGRPHAYMVQEIEAHLGAPLAEGWEAEYLPLYEEAFASELVAIDGIAEVLEGLAVPTCVASSSSHASIRRSLDLAGLRHHFGERIFSVDDVPNAKPAPDVFLHAAEQMGADPDRCAVVEDSFYGVEAARAAGMRVLAFAGGLTPAGRLAGPGTTVFDHMRDLSTLLAEPA